MPREIHDRVFQTRTRILGREASVWYHLWRIRQPRRRLGAHRFFLSFWRCSRISRQVNFIPFDTCRVEHAPKGHDDTISIEYPGCGPAVRTVRMTTFLSSPPFGPPGTPPSLPALDTFKNADSRGLSTPGSGGGALKENPSRLQSTGTRSRACDPTKGRARQSPGQHNRSQWEAGRLER